MFGFVIKPITAGSERSQAHVFFELLKYFKGRKALFCCQKLRNIFSSITILAKRTTLFHANLRFFFVIGLYSRSFKNPMIVH